MKELIPLASQTAALLRERGQTLAVAESSAGGLISAALLAIPGASDYFLGGGVIYTVQARAGLLGLSPDHLGEIRSASEPYAALLARTLCTRLGAHWALAESGASGPSGNRYGDQPGHTALAVMGGGAVGGAGGVGGVEIIARSRTLETGHGDREANMRAFASAALTLLNECLGEG